MPEQLNLPSTSEQQHETVILRETIGMTERTHASTGCCECMASCCAAPDSRNKQSVAPKHEPTTPRIRTQSELATMDLGIVGTHNLTKT